MKNLTINFAEINYNHCTKDEARELVRTNILSQVLQEKIRKPIVATTDGFRIRYCIKCVYKKNKDMEIYLESPTVILQTLVEFLHVTEDFKDYSINVIKYKDFKKNVEVPYIHIYVDYIRGIKDDVEDRNMFQFLAYESILDLWNCRSSKKNGPFFKSRSVKNNHFTLNKVEVNDKYEDIYVTAPAMYYRALKKIAADAERNHICNYCYVVNRP